MFRDLKRKGTTNASPSLGLGLDAQALVKYEAKPDDFEHREAVWPGVQ